MDFIKEYFVTMILIFLMIIILLGFGIEIYRILNEDNNVDIAEISENTQIIDNNITKEENKIKQTNSSTRGYENETQTNEVNSDLDIVEESDSKVNEIVNDLDIVEEIDTQINDYKLDEIANIFNNCEASEKMRPQGFSMTAISADNGITLYFVGNGVDFNIEFVRDNNILYAEVVYEKSDPTVVALKETLAVILLDCVGQLKGYNEGELFKALENDIAKNYTIENEGVEIKQLNNRSLVIKVDLNSDFSFLNT